MYDNIYQFTTGARVNVIICDVSLPYLMAAAGNREVAYYLSNISEY